MSGVHRPVVVLAVVLAVGVALSGIAGATGIDNPAANESAPATDVASTTMAATGELLVTPTDQPAMSSTSETVGTTATATTGAVTAPESAIAGTTDDTTAADDATDAAGGATDRTVTTLNDTADAVNDTTDRTATTLNDTTDAVNDTTDRTATTLNDTTDAVNDTTDRTATTLNDTTDAVNDTAGATNATVDATTDVVGKTVNGTTDTVDAVVSGPTNDSVLADVTRGTTSTVDDTTTALLDETDDLTAATVDEAETATPRPDAGGLDVAPVATDPEDGSTTAERTASVTARHAPTPDLVGGTDRGQTSDAVAERTAAAPRDASGEQVPAGFDSGAIAGLGAVAVGASLAGAGGLERELAARVASALERMVRMVAPLRYSQFDESDPLAHEDRAAIQEYVAEHPGAYVSAVSEAVGLNHSTARHHVKMLTREGIVEDAKVRGRRRLFPAHAQQQELAAAMADESTAEVLEAIARLGPCSGSALADDLNRAVSTVSHHLSRLADEGLVIREKDGRTMVNSLPSDVQEALAPDPEPVTAEARTVSAD